ncbi:MAG: O-antigen ligase family protein [Patescibacteria group bacterium]
MWRKNNFPEKLAWWICAILLALLPFHAFLFTWFHSFFWQEDFVIFFQAWKEILVGILCFLALVKLFATRELPREKSFWLAGIFVSLAIFYGIFGNNEFSQRILGLRTATLFLGIFLAVKFFDFDERAIERLKKIVLFASGLVILFALAQKFLLPADFLKHFGYSENISSWLPGGNLPIFHTVGDSETIRLQSTFAGPNQLAAFLIVILPLAAAGFFRWKNFWRWLAAGIFCGGIFVLIFTFSRSAWLGFAAIFLIFAIRGWRKDIPKKLKRKFLFGGAIGILALGIFGIASLNSREILAREASTSAHLERSIAAAKLVLQNPLGIGLGKSAGVSQRFGEEITPENTFLGVALETGWLGGILFLIFLISLLAELRRKNSELFYSLLGITIIALFLHPLEDTPTALTLFLLIGSRSSKKVEES